MAHVVLPPPAPNVPPPPPPDHPTPPPVTPPLKPTLGAPIGTIKGNLQIAFGRGADWQRVNRWDSFFLASGKKHRVAPQMLKAMAVIESGGEMIWNLGGSGAYGIMQIKAAIWGNAARSLGYDLNDPAGNIGFAAALVGGDVPGAAAGNTPEERFLTFYYPTAGLDVPGEDGHTPRQYLSDMHELMRQIDAAVIPGTTPVPVAVTQQDILNLISNNAAGVYISFPFRGSGNAIYAYGKGHGTNSSSEHSGIDIWMPDETPVSCVFGGDVICVGSAGRVVWGQGCGSFVDNQGGTGNITILTNAKVKVKGTLRQIKMTYGHMSTSRVTVGQVVRDGQRIGTSGVGGGWPHVHLDVAVKENFVGELNNPQIWNNVGEYHLIDPIPAIIGAMGGAALPPSYPDPFDVPQPSEMDVFATVLVEEDGLKVYQRASRHAPESHEPLKKGDDFLGAMQIIGPEKEIFWVTSNKNRVPVKGTKTTDWPT